MWSSIQFYINPKQSREDTPTVMMIPFLQTVADTSSLLLTMQAFPIFLAKHGKASLVGEVGWRNPRVHHAPIIISIGFHSLAYSHSCRPTWIFRDCPANQCTVLHTVPEASPNVPEFQACSIMLYFPITLIYMYCEYVERVGIFNDSESENSQD